jgi:hypothetical protein
VVELDAVASFSTSDSSVMRVRDATGFGLGVGLTTIVVEYGGLSDAVDVEITSIAPVMAGDLVINEVLADATVDGDPNGDGESDAMSDEFIELANVADIALDLSGVTIREVDFMFLPRHTFVDGTVLLPGEAIVVFGGGDVDTLETANAHFVTAQNADPGIEYGLNLGDDGDTLTLEDFEGLLVLEWSYGDDMIPAVSDQSLTLTPDVWGADYAAHSDAGGGDYSPGTWSDGSAFEGVDGRF